jgi:Flp pilus assembly protein TadD
VHNWILQTAVSTGVLGVAFLSVTLIVAGATLITRIRRDPQLLDLVLLTAAIAYWVHALVAPVSISVDWAPWVIFGVLVATEPRVVTVVKQSQQRGVLAAITLTLVTIGSFTPLIAAGASRNAWAASSLVAEGDTDAIQLARQAVNGDPGRAQYWAVLGQAFARQGRWNEAATSFDEAARRAPYEWSRWSDLAMALASGGRDASELRHAMDVGGRAVDLDPYEPAAHAALARLAFMTGANDLALRSATVAVKLFPSGGYDRLVFTAALLRLERPGDARPLITSDLERRSTPDLHLALAAVEFQLGNGDAGRTEVELARTQGATAAEVDRVLRLSGG